MQADHRLRPLSPEVLRQQGARSGSGDYGQPQNGKEDCSRPAPTLATGVVHCLEVTGYGLRPCIFRTRMGT